MLQLMSPVYVHGTATIYWPHYNSLNLHPLKVSIFVKKLSILRKNKILHLKQINSYWRDYIMMSTPAGFDCLRLILLRYYLA